MVTRPPRDDRVPRRAFARPGGSAPPRLVAAPSEARQRRSRAAVARNEADPDARPAPGPDKAERGRTDRGRIGFVSRPRPGSRVRSARGRGAGLGFARRVGGGAEGRERPGRNRLRRPDRAAPGREVPGLRYPVRSGTRPAPLGDAPGRAQGWAPAHSSRRDTPSVDGGPSTNGTSGRREARPDPAPNRRAGPGPRRAAAVFGTDHA